MITHLCNSRFSLRIESQSVSLKRHFFFPSSGSKRLPHSSETPKSLWCSLPRACGCFNTHARRLMSHKLRAGQSPESLQRAFEPPGAWRDWDLKWWRLKRTLSAVCSSPGSPLDGGDAASKRSGFIPSDILQPQDEEPHFSICECKISYRSTK